MSDALTIASHRGPYRVSFDERPFVARGAERAHFIIDERVAGLYREELAWALGAPSVLLLEASEAGKSLDRFPGYVEHLVSRGVRRGHLLVAIGGGIMQDITCFLAATLLRGLTWHFYPTTLLAQADSCIGSKSSINVGSAKNILGTFTPPEEVFVSTRVLRTLRDEDVRSGIGEMLKVHAIEGPDSFDRIAADYEGILTDDGVMIGYIRDSLAIKKRLIEIDEFDRGPRNVMNYGHTFGHAIESATDYLVPHGIAVTIGMDMANFVALRLGVTSSRHVERMKGVLRKNASGFTNLPVPVERFFAALLKDKKHTDDGLKLILPDGDGRITIGLYRDGEEFRQACTDYLHGVGHW